MRRRGVSSDGSTELRGRGAGGWKRAVYRGHQKMAVTANSMASVVVSLFGDGICLFGDEPEGGRGGWYAAKRGGGCVRKEIEECQPGEAEFRERPCAAARGNKRRGVPADSVENRGQWTVGEDRDQ